MNGIEILDCRKEHLRTGDEEGVWSETDWYCFKDLEHSAATSNWHYGSDEDYMYCVIIFEGRPEVYRQKRTPIEMLNDDDLEEILDKWLPTTWVDFSEIKKQSNFYLETEDDKFKYVHVRFLDVHLDIYRQRKQ